MTPSFDITDAKLNRLKINEDMLEVAKGLSVASLNNVKDKEGNEIKIENLKKGRVNKLVADFAKVIGADNIFQFFKGHEGYQDHLFSLFELLQEDQQHILLSALENMKVPFFAKENILLSGVRDSVLEDKPIESAILS